MLRWHHLQTGVTCVTVLTQSDQSLLMMMHCALPMMAKPDHSRWLNYYDRGFLPWDSRAPATQLRWLLNTRCVCALLKHSRVRPRSDISPSPAVGLVRHGDVWLVEEPPHQRVCKRLSIDQPAALHSSPSDHDCCPQCRDSRVQWTAGASTALELCCGTGASVVHLSLRGFHAVGVDVAPAAIQACLTTAEQAGVTQSALTARKVSAQHDHVPGAPQLPSTPTGTATFLCADVLSLPRPFTWHDAVAAAQQAPSTPGTAQQDSIPQNSTAATPHKCMHSPSTAPAPAFDFIYDCQSYHVLRQIDEPAVMDLFRQSVKPGGLMMLLVGAQDPAEPTAIAAATTTTNTATSTATPLPAQPSHTPSPSADDQAAVLPLASSDNNAHASTSPTVAQASPAGSHAQPHQPKASSTGAQVPAPAASGPTAQPLGPPQLSQTQLAEAFSNPDWEWQFLVLTRFDPTDYYTANYDQPPLAWWAVVKRTGTLA